jgi:hypothetical protein
VKTSTRTQCLYEATGQQCSPLPTMGNSTSDRLCSAACRAFGGRLSPIPCPSDGLPPAPVFSLRAWLLLPMGVIEARECSTFRPGRDLNFSVATRIAGARPDWRGSGYGIAVQQITFCANSPRQSRSLAYRTLGGKCCPQTARGEFVSACAREDSLTDSSAVGGTGRRTSSWPAIVPNGTDQPGLR